MLPKALPVKFAGSVWTVGVVSLTVQSGVSAMRSAVGVARAMVALVLLVLAGALADNHKISRHIPASRVIRALTKADQQSGCMYDGRWYAAGASVRTRDACLACACARGALSCRQRSCSPLPEPPPRCHVIHRRGECCPELRCADGVEHQHGARLDDAGIDTPPSDGHVFPVCAEGGAVYAAGSAMGAGAACEQCFCLGGARRCVRPRCLPPPPGCVARPPPGACCPQRYYCEHALADPLPERNPHDCVTPEGTWAMEGERVKAAEVGMKCIQCFCLRGSIRCQHLACAPSLQGCTPLVHPGQCCPHQYQCQRLRNDTMSKTPFQRQNLLMSLKDEDRSLHMSKSTKRETSLKGLTTATDKSAVVVTKTDPITTAKVIEKNVELNTTSTRITPEKSANISLTTAQTTPKVNDITPSTVTESTTVKESSEEFLTEQPEGSVKVLINGTINCTTELSSTSLLLNVSDTNNTAWINSLTQPRIPIINNIELESHTLSPNDIITQGNYKEYDENETFTINVTSSLRSNSTHSTTTTTKPLSALPKTVSPALMGNKNISKVKKDEYDYDYTGPTLPPSLPNLKIIPFVAADAVVEDDISSKESLDYTVLDREDKYPVYYPNKEPKETIYATRKDVYDPTQYPIFISKKVDPQYSSLTQETDSVNVPYPSITNEMSAPVQEYTVTASMGNSAKINYKGENLPSNTHSQFEVKPPAVNLFSPPMETEGGFVPKEPGIIDDYYSMYPSTPPGNLVPHLTTSMQLEPRDECISNDGRHVMEGESISFACSICSCAWGELHCAPRPCNTPPGCKRKSASISTELCCGELICEKIQNTTVRQQTESQNFENKINLTKISNTNEKAQVYFQESSTVSSTVSTYDGEVKKDIILEKIEKQNKKPLESMIPVSLLTMPTETSNYYTTSTEIPDKVHVDNTNQSLEYDEEDDSDGFSLGSVLKLLLSETYETTTTAPKKKFSPSSTTIPKTTTNAPTFTTTMKLVTSESGFMPVAHRSPYMPPKKLYPHDTISRIDHLVLGESSAIRKATPKPIAFKPIPTSTMKKSTMVTSTTTQQPITTKTVEIASKEGFVGQQVDVRPPAPNFISGIGLGLPKLAGCNIYGRMYRVGRIITELSSPCQECKCTELGVQCRSLSC